ncbi:MAG: hypothetical protein HY951_18475 [Bacteroidia bacterium]|nr:hypothetical protein [Bacteroidia bacterium]
MFTFIFLVDEIAHPDLLYLSIGNKSINDSVYITYSPGSYVLKDDIYIVSSNKKSDPYNFLNDSSDIIFFGSGILNSYSVIDSSIILFVTKFPELPRYFHSSYKILFVRDEYNKEFLKVKNPKMEIINVSDTFRTLLNNKVK